MKLNYWPQSFELQPGLCPCDLDFLDYLEKNAITRKVIFHFGTGAHHIIGKKSHEMGLQNHVLGITASTTEYQNYMDHVINHPTAANYYHVLFGDIHTLSAEILPKFDLVTLFHLAEYHHPVRSKYARLDSRGLLMTFLQCLHPGGRLFFYKGSSHFHLAAPILAEAVRHGYLRQCAEHLHLLIFEQTCEGGK